MIWFRAFREWARQAFRTWPDIDPDYLKSYKRAFRAGYRAGYRAANAEGKGQPK